MSRGGQALEQAPGPQVIFLFTILSPFHWPAQLSEVRILMNPSYWDWVIYSQDSNPV